jgi:hypothetical protein
MQSDPCQTKADPKEEEEEVRVVHPVKRVPRFNRGTPTKKRSLRISSRPKKINNNVFLQDL